VAGKYRLIEVDLEGNGQVVAEATVTIGSQLQASLAGGSLKLQLVGPPNGTVTVQTSADVVNGPWSMAGAVSLDGTGAGVLTIPFDKNVPAQFLRLLEQ
jgi:hypothetical protein